MEFKADQLVKEARAKAGISQRELARRAHTSQSVVARIELGKVNPTAETIKTLVQAAGFNVEIELNLRPVTNTHMMNDVERILQLSAEERLRELATTETFIKAARRV